MSLEQTRQDLREAKARLSGQGESLSLSAYMAEHPYVSMGAAFLSGALMGGAREVRDSIVQAIVGVIHEELVQKRKKDE